MFRKCIFSSNYFNGFEVDIDVYTHNTIERILDYARNRLIQYLESGNLIDLSLIARRRDFHVHNIRMEDINDHPDVIIYICDHH